MKVDHIGYITDNIDQSSVEFIRLGYTKGNVVADEIQKCNICFLTNELGERIELVEPFENNKSLQKLLTQRGVSPYHTCYVVDDVEALFDELSEQAGWMPLFRPVEAAAFGNRLIMYFYNAAIGYVEFVNKK